MDTQSLSEICSPWALYPPVLKHLAARLLAEDVELEQAAEETWSRVNASPERGGSSIAILPVQGVIRQRVGFASTANLEDVFKRLVADKGVSAIVLDVDSPGGSVFGVGELSDVIRAARGTKPIVAQVNSMAASAAYWIASAADEIAMTPSGMAGSIGVWSMHVDASRACDEAGYTVSLISAGRYKVEGNPFEPLSEEAQARMQQEVNVYYDSFVNSVAKNRAISREQVISDFGEGRVFQADEAMSARMVDRIATLPETLNRIKASSLRGSGVAYVDKARRTTEVLRMKRRRNENGN